MSSITGILYQKADGTYKIITGSLIMPGDGHVKEDGITIAWRRGEKVEYNGRQLVVPVGKVFSVDDEGRSCVDGEPI